MRITTRGRYALRASLALARLQKQASSTEHQSDTASEQSSGSHPVLLTNRKGREPPVSINQLAGEEQISSVFLEQIFFKLRKAGIVNSIRGPGGGFQFARALDKISLKEILEAAGEELNVIDCDKNAKVCKITGKKCLSHSVWEDINRVLDDYFKNTTLAKVLERETVPHPAKQH